ncbi:MAG: entericidin A/B family lipoprotein [Desulfuromonadales bacterium]
MRRLALLVLALNFLWIAAGCETVRGFGKDMQQAGNWVERKAR